MTQVVPRHPDTPLNSAGRVYRDLEAFYAENPARRWSGEIDYGVLWRLGRPPGSAEWRISYVARTGELYVTPSAAATPVVVAAVFAGVDECEQTLDGWADACGGPGSLTFLERCIGPHVLQHPAFASVDRPHLRPL